MVLKIAINGEKKSIAGRTSRPVIFINGVKKRLTKGITFINGEKKYLWGTGNKIDVFTMTNTVYTGYNVGTPIYIDEKRLALDGLTILDIRNTSVASTIQNYAWGGFGVFSGYSENNTTYSSGASSSGVLNEIVYDGGDTGLVRYAFTFNMPSTSATFKSARGARLNNGNYLVIYSVNVSSGTYQYSLYKNNTKIQDLGSTSYTLAENVGDGILAYNSSYLYKITESGVGNALYNAYSIITGVRKFNNNIYICTGNKLIKLDSSYGNVWDCDLRNLPDSSVVLGDSKLIGIGQDNRCYVLTSYGTRYGSGINISVKLTGFIIQEISLDTGDVINIYPFTHYNEYGDLIDGWKVGSYVSNSGYLALVAKTTSSSDKIVVARIFVG